MSTRRRTPRRGRCARPAPLDWRRRVISRRSRTSSRRSRRTLPPELRQFWERVDPESVHVRTFPMIGGPATALASCAWRVSSRRPSRSDCRRSCFPSTTRATATGWSSSPANGRRREPSRVRLRRDGLVSHGVARLDRAARRAPCRPRSSSTTAGQSSTTPPCWRKGSPAWRWRPAAILLHARADPDQLQLWPAHWLAASGIDLRDREPRSARPTRSRSSSPRRPRVASPAGSRRGDPSRRKRGWRACRRRRRQLASRRLVSGRHEPLGPVHRTRFEFEVTIDSPVGAPPHRSRCCTSRPLDMPLQATSSRLRLRCPGELDRHRAAAVASDIRPLD